MRFLNVLFVFVLFSFSMQAQLKPFFDGENDFAFVHYSDDLDFGSKSDFNYEFFITPKYIAKEMALFSRHDGTKGIVCGINKESYPVLRINKEVYTLEKSLKETNIECLHLAFQRKKEDLFIAVNGEAFEVGSNGEDLISKADAIIGYSPKTEEGYYSGRVNEARIWDIFLKEKKLQKYAEECLKYNQKGLIAYWKMDEGYGQVFNDLVGNHHARLGKSPSEDDADPIWEDAPCQKEDCCTVKANFSFDPSEAKVNSPLTFTNYSIDANDYTWYIDGIKVSTDEDLIHTFTEEDIYLVTLAAFAQQKCKSVFSMYVTVLPPDPVFFCGEYVKPLFDVQEYDPPFLFADRFGNDFWEAELIIPEEFESNLLPSASQSRGAPVSVCDCQTDFGISTGYFELYFEDCMMSTGTGFDDQTTTSTAAGTLGADRRKTICQVYNDLSQTIQQSTPVCGGTPAKVKVKIMPSAANNYYPGGLNLVPLPGGVGGVASGYASDLFTNGIRNAFPWHVITSGEDPLASSLAGYHGYIRINFTNFGFNWHLDHTTAPLSTEVDLYTVTLHESIHMLGMGSSTYFDGSVWTSRISNTSVGGYSGWDKLIKRASPSYDIIENVASFDWDYNSLLTLPNDLLNSCNGVDLVVGSTGVPVYTGTPSMYNPGSSLSHLDENCNSTSYVMHPSVVPGTSKQTLGLDEEAVLEEMGYDLSGSPCQVIATNDLTEGCKSTPYTIEACAGNTITIEYNDIVANDINVTGINQIEVYNNLGTLTPVNPGNPQTDYVFSPLTNANGYFYIRYIPEGCSGQLGNEAYIQIEAFACSDCGFQFLAAAQANNPNIITPPANCGTTLSTPKCVDCGENRNPSNLICNPEFCSGQRENLNIMYTCGTIPAEEVPGWERAGAMNVWWGATSSGSIPTLTPNSGMMAVGCFNSPLLQESGTYTSVSVVPGKNYFYSMYSKARKSGSVGSVDLEVELITDNAVSTYFNCSYYNTFGYLTPPIPATESFFISSINHIISPATIYAPYTRWGKYFLLPNGFTGDNLYIHPEFDNTNTEAHVGLEQIELVEDNFTAGPDQNFICGQSLTLGGTDFGMLSEVKVQYTWTNLTTGMTELDYTLERELDGTLLIQDLINATALTQIPTLTILPPVTTTYRLTRTFILDGDGTFGGLDANYFNGVPLTDDVVITVPAYPVADPAFTVANNCYDYTFTSHPSSLGSNFSHSWDFDGDGNMDNFTENPTYTYPVSGTYTVTHVVNNGCGNFTSSQTIVVTDDLTLSVIPSGTGPFNTLDPFTVDVIVTNTGTNTISNIVLDVPNTPNTAGLSFTYPPTNIGTLAAGQMTTITIPVVVSGACGDPQICASIVSADNACTFPTECSPTIIIQDDPYLHQILQISSSISTTYPPPFVVGGLIEFEVVVENISGNTITNIDLDYFENGVVLISALPANFSLGPNAITTFNVLASVSDCTAFSLESVIQDADDTCPDTNPSSIANGSVTPYVVSVDVPDLICSGATGLTADFTVTNPSGQAISDVNLTTLFPSSLFQNVSGPTSLNLPANGSALTSITFESNGTTGTDDICVSIASVGTGASAISYNCNPNITCEPVTVTSSTALYTVTLTSSPPNGTPICVDQNPNITYTLEIKNISTFDLNGLSIISTLTGLNLNSGQVIPSSANIAAGMTETYVFTASGINTAASADMLIDVYLNNSGCSSVSASTSHPLYRNVQNALSMTSSISVPGPYVFGQTIQVDFVIENLTPHPITGVQLNFINAGGSSQLTNIILPTPFTVPGGIGNSTTQTVTATINDCDNFSWYAEIKNTNNTCTGIIWENSGQIQVDPFIIQVLPIDFICAGSSGNIQVEVTNPASQAINDVHLSVAGATSGSLFSALNLTSPVTLSSGVNTLNIPYSALSGVAGTETICVSLDQIGTLAYPCANSQSCEDADVGEAISVVIQALPNVTSLCQGGYINFIVSLQNNMNTSASVAFNNVLNGVNELLNTPTSGTTTIAPGAYFNTTYVTQVNGNNAFASILANVNQTGFPNCAGTISNSLSIPVSPSQAALDVTTAITSTYSAPFVVGGFVEFEVTVENTSAAPVNNVDLDFITSGLVDVTPAPANFSLSAGGIATYLVTGIVLDCSTFDLTAQINGTSWTCGGALPSDQASGSVTPYTLSITTPDLVCNGTTGIPGTVSIFNPSGQTISGLNLGLTAASTLFQNVTPLTNIVLAPNTTTNGNFTFDSNSTLGTDDVCVTLNSITNGTTTVPYACTGNNVCETTTVVNNPIQVTLTSNPVNGTPICVDQNDNIDYTLTIINPNNVDVNGIAISSTLTGAALTNGTIPTSLSLPANQTQVFNFSASAGILANTAGLLIDVMPGITGCANTSVNTSHPIHRDLDNLLQISNVITTAPPYVVGQTVSFQVSVDNLTGNTINNVGLIYAVSGLDNPSASPANFSVGPNGTVQFTVTGVVSDCSLFELVADITGADDACLNNPVSANALDSVTSYGISVTSSSMVCAGATNIPGTVVITNPSNQTINDVNVNTYGVGALFQNISTIGTIALAPGVNTFNITFDNNGATGTDDICTEIVSIGSGASLISYANCGGSTACAGTLVTASPVTVTLTANPVNGSVICVDQNANIDYTLTIDNPNNVDANNLTINAILNGWSLNAGNMIPTTVSVPANSSANFTFSGTATNTATSADLLIDVISTLPGCATISASTNHPLNNDLDNVLQVSSVLLTTGSIVVGQNVDFEVTIQNIGPNNLSNIDLDYTFNGMVNGTANPANFSLNTGLSTSFVISGVAGICGQIDLTAEILSADQTCVTNIPSTNTGATVVPYGLQISGPDLVCAGSFANMTLTVTNPSSQTISNVMIVPGTNPSVGLFTNFPLLPPANLLPGNNTFTFSATAAGNVSGFENICASIDQIGSIFYGCTPNEVCKSVEVTDEPLSIHINQTTSGVLCSDGQAVFDVVVTNNTGVDLTNIDLQMTNVNGFTLASLFPASFTVPAGIPYQFSVIASINSGVSSMDFCLEVMSIGNLSCASGIQECTGNIDVSDIEPPIEVQDVFSGGVSALTNEIIYDFVIDQNGDLYATGAMTTNQAELLGVGSSIISSSTTCSFTVWPFVFKYSNGGVEWIRTPDACGIPTAIDVDDAGNVFVAMNILSDLTFNATTFTHMGGLMDIAILRYDENGIEVDAFTEGGDGGDYVSDLKVDGSRLVIIGNTTDLPAVLQPPGYSGQYSLAGTTYNYNSYSGPLYNQNFGDGFTASYNYTATSISSWWSRIIEAAIIPNKLDIAPNGYVYVIGVAMEVFDFPIPQAPGGPGPQVNTDYAGGIPAVLTASNNDIDAFIISYRNQGTNYWGRLFGTSGVDYPETVATNQNGIEYNPYHQTDIAVSESGEVYAALQSTATYFFPPVPGSTLSFQTELGVHLVNVDEVTGIIGSTEWSIPAASPLSAAIGGAGPGSFTVTGNTVRFPAISVDADDNVYLIGDYFLQTGGQESVDFYSANGGPAPLVLPAGNTFELGLVLEKFDQGGNFQWAEVNRSFYPYTGPYNPNFTSILNPLRPMDLEVNECGIYHSIVLNGTLDVGGVTYEGAPYDAFIFRLVETPSGLVFTKTTNEDEITSLESEDEILVYTESDDLTPQGEMVLYPNPNTGRFTLDLTNVEQISSVQVINVHGKVELDIPLSTDDDQLDKYSIDLSDKAAGIYYVRIIAKDQILTTPVIVVR